MEKGEERLRYNNLDNHSMRTKGKTYHLIQVHNVVGRLPQKAYSRGRYCHGYHGSPDNRL